MPQTKKQKQEKVLEYWEKRLQFCETAVSLGDTRISPAYIRYIRGQIDILTRKLHANPVRKSSHQLDDYLKEISSMDTAMDGVYD